MENSMGMGGPPPPTEAARQQVSTPATLLIVTGALSMLLVLVNVVLSRFNFGQVTPEMRQQYERLGMAWMADMLERIQDVQTSAPYVLIALVLGGIVLFGGLKMKRLESWGLALVAAILSLLCCQACCLSMAAGIWSLVVLFKPEVKAAFR